MKKRLSVFAALLIVLSMVFGITAEAAPRYRYAAYVSSVMSISSSRTATCSSTASGGSVTKVIATQYLQYKNGSTWQTVPGATWTSNQSGSSFFMTNTKSSLTKGTVYRLRTIFTVYSGSSTETITADSNEVTCP